MHHGRLEIYLATAFAVFAATALLPLVLTGGLPGLGGATDLTFYEWGVVVLALAGLVGVALGYGVAIAAHLAINAALF